MPISLRGDKNYSAPRTADYDDLILIVGGKGVWPTDAVGSEYNCIANGCRRAGFSQLSTYELIFSCVNALNATITVDLVTEKIL
jgi:hypothetical protein